MKTLDDAFIPMEAKDFPAMHEQKRRRNEHWSRLRLARQDYQYHDGFVQWIERTHGIAIVLTGSGEITDNYEIVDRKKYTLFLLKYSQ